MALLYALCCTLATPLKWLSWPSGLLQLDPANNELHGQEEESDKGAGHCNDNKLSSPRQMLNKLLSLQIHQVLSSFDPGDNTAYPEGGVHIAH